MKFKTKKEAIATITLRSRTVNGKEYPMYDTYLGVNALTKKPERLYASTKERLIDAIEEHYRSRDESGDFASVLSAEQIVDARAAFRALKRAHLSLSLLDCATREIERQGVAEGFTKKIGEAYDDFIEVKEKQNSEGELHKTNATTGRWVSAVGRDRVLSDITINEITSYLKTNFDASAPRTYNANVSYIKTFLSWCANADNRFIPENPALPIKLRPVAWKRPKYLKPDEVKRLFGLLWSVRNEHPEYLALAVTQFFIGVRREEVLRIAQNPDAATIIIEDETFRVDKGKGFTKGVASRTAHLSENAVAWMKSFDYAGSIAKVTHETTFEYYKLARDHKIPMFSNCARHTFITMHVAKYHTPEVTQAMVGTSGTMRAAHYDGLAPQREGEAYFAIMPPTIPCPSGS